MSHLLEIIILFSPAFVANGMPVMVMNIPGLREWKTPIWEGFGKNKTWRGLVFGVAAAVIVSIFLSSFETIWLRMLWGFLLGIGALGGDMIESFVKRQMGIAPGNALPFWDGVDYILGALLLGSLLSIPSLEEAVFLIIVGPLLSLICNVISYFMGLKKVWY